jgi:hypothetical protein
MLHLKSYVGSIVLASLLLQGCGSSSSSTDSGDTTNETSVSAIQTETAITSLSDTINSLDSTSTDGEIKAAFDDLKLQLSAPESTDSSTLQGVTSRGLLTNSIGDVLTNALNSNLGDKVTGAAFDVVLNSEGVTVVMLDLARGSDTITDIMVNALEANWDLTTKMCPMLRTNTEFGEKFTALAEEKESVARFFFERIDSQMYGCLTDAMLLSNNDAVHDEGVAHSTNAYMGILMDRYATDYFITPDGNTSERRNDKFVSLLLDTGDIVDYNSTAKTFEGHGDANELTNEKFFYSLFKTPTTTDSFVNAMDKVDVTTRTMLMDNIFLGAQLDKNDTTQGYLNIISIGSAMYDGIYGVANSEGARSGGYGFGAYSGAFIGFAGLIPDGRFLTYGRAFMNAGYQYASFHSIDVWAGVADTIQTAWNNYTAPTEAAEVVAQSTTIARSAGLGLVSSDWYDDILDLMINAWSNVRLTDIGAALLDSDRSVMSELSDQGNRAYGTFVDGRDENNQTVLDTKLTNGTVHNDTVYGLHGLIELAMQEDAYYLECGNRSTDYILTSTPTCENNASYTMDNAKAGFTLPSFADLTWSFAYGTAKNGAMTYYNNNVDAEWFADLSSNELIRQYFYPDAGNVYIPSWLLAVDWLKITNNYNNAEIAATDFNYNSGYFDIYVTSTNANILTAGSEIDLAQVVSIVKTIEITQINMGDDTIIAVDENGTSLAGLYVYKVRTVSPEDTQAVLTYLSNLGDSALAAIGLDSSNAANVDTTEEVTAN